MYHPIHLAESFGISHTVHDAEAIICNLY